MDYLQYCGISSLGYVIPLRREVLNLIINGLPSILKYNKDWKVKNKDISFKPYYKWITFNTLFDNYLNILLSFKPYYKWITFNTSLSKMHGALVLGFKPYYKWITFNTL